MNITRMEKDYKKIQDLLLQMNRETRQLMPLDFSKIDFETAGYNVIKEGFIDGRAVERVIIILRGPGCEWARKENGGCIMCGHFAGSSRGRPIAHESLRHQFDKAVEAFDFAKYPMLCLYNGGSFLNAKEIPGDVRRYMFKRIQSIGHIRRLTIESRPEYITDEIFTEIEETMPGVPVEIGVGLESSNDVVRNVILNKGIVLDEYRELGKKFQERSTRFLAYVLVKPPFLTESEIISDAVSTIEFASSIGVEAVYLEPVSIQEFTLISLMREARLYSPPWIWSVFEIIKRTAHLGIELRIGGFDFYPVPREFASNCRTCDKEMIQKIKAFNRCQDPHLLKNLECPDHCELRWERECMMTEPGDFWDRIASTLETLRTLQISKNKPFKLNGKVQKN